MMRSFIAATIAASLAVALAVPASAGERSGGYSSQGGGHPNSTYYRGSPQVRGYVSRRGGYSYSYEDTINTYGDSRSNFGGANIYRDPRLDRQTDFGPFDHGFFFDGGVQQRGGDAPYLN